MSDGGPAFPVPGFKDNEEFNGMTLRDYFAAKAITGLLATEANPRFGTQTQPFMGQQDSIDWFAKMSYQIADAMLAARGAK